MLQLSQGGNISILQSHRLRLFFWKRCTVLNLFFNLANWQKCTWSWWSGWKQEFPCRQLAWPFFRVIFSRFHEDCFRNCAYKKKFKPNCLFELEMICKVISNCWFYNYREEIRPFYKSYSLFGCDIRGLIQVINNYDTTPTIRVFSSSLIYFCRITMSDMVGGGDGGREVSGEGRAGKVLSTFVRLNDADLLRRWAPARLQGTILKKRLLCLDPAEKMIMCKKGTHCYVFLWNYHDTKTLQAGASQKFEFRTFI